MSHNKNPSILSEPTSSFLLDPLAVTSSIGPQDLNPTRVECARSPLATLFETFAVHYANWIALIAERNRNREGEREGEGSYQWDARARRTK